MTDADALGFWAGSYVAVAGVLIGLGGLFLRRYETRLRERAVMQIRGTEHLFAEVRARLDHLEEHAAGEERPAGAPYRDGCCRTCGRPLAERNSSSAP